MSKRQPREANTAYRRVWRSSLTNYAGERARHTEMERRRRARIRKQWCPKKHDPPEWVTNVRGARVCMKCHREQNRAWWARRKERGNGTVHSEQGSVREGDSSG